MVYSIILILILFLVTILSLDISKHPSGIGENILSFTMTNSMRGIAILAIILGHISGTMGTVVLTPFGGTGVAIFLFLSGYGLNESYKNYGLKSYWRKKIKRVFIPYAIVITCLYVFRHKYDLMSYLLDITGMKTSYWYIGYLMKWYIAYYLFTRFLPKYRIYLMLLFSVVILFLFPNIEAEQAFSFLLGVIVSSHIKYLRSLSIHNLVVLGVVAFFMGIVFLEIKQMSIIRAHETDWIYNVVQCGIKMPLGIGVMVFVSCISLLTTSRFLQLTGRISYELYLVHMPFYGLVQGNLLYALLLIIASFVIAYVFYEFNNKVSKIIR